MNNCKEDHTCTPCDGICKPQPGEAERLLDEAENFAQLATAQALAKDALLEKMQRISEDAYCAGWMSDIEYSLWNCVETGKTNYGMLDSVPVDELQKLSDLANRWWVWDGNNGPKFVTIDEWKQLRATKDKS